MSLLYAALKQYRCILGHQRYNWVGSQRYTIAGSSLLPAGKATVRFEFAYDGGRGGGGAGTIYVNGQQVGQGRIDHTNANMFSGDEAADVGVDKGTPVTEEYKQKDNRFTGRIVKIVVQTGDTKLSDADKQELNKEKKASNDIID